MIKYLLKKAGKNYTDLPLLKKEVDEEETQEEKDKIFCELVWKKWNEEKINVPEKDWEKYKKEIVSFERRFLICHMAGYILSKLQKQGPLVQ